MRPRPFTTLPPSARVVCGLAFLGIAAFAFLLAPRWAHDPDLSHGLVTPLLVAILVHESRVRGTPRFLAETAWIRGLTASALLAGTVLVALGGLFAGSLDWAHPLVCALLGAALAALLGGSLLHLAGDAVRCVPFNGPSIVAVLLWPLSAPLPPGTATRLSLALQQRVTDAVLGTLHVLGVAAERAGNLIHLAHTTIGVEEACSGVRSLVACVAAGLFFSGTLVRRPLSRAIVVAAAAPLALAMNFLRSLGLTLLAHRGIDISGTWHDVTGFAILGFTAASLSGLALVLARVERPPRAAHGDGPPPSPRALTPGRPARGGWGVPATLAMALAVAGGLALAHRPAPRDASVVAPDLSALLPTAAPGWESVVTGDLHRFSATLRTDRLLQRTYRRASPHGPLELTVYLSYWEPGQAAVSLVATHTPEACWPGTGWELRARQGAGAPLLLGDRSLAAPAYCLFENEGLPQHVWYWHLHEGRPITRGEPLSPRDLLRLSVRYGFRPAGDQAFVRISSNRPISEWRDDPLVVEIARRLRALGL